MTLALTSAFSQTTFTTIGALRNAIDALQLPKTGASNTTTVDYTLSGEAVLTYLYTSSTGVKTMYIQDATGAIMVYGAANTITTNYNLYDGISGISGKIQNYNGMYEIKPTVDTGAATSIAHVPFTSVLTTLNNVNNYIGQLVTVKNLTINDQTKGATGSFVVSKNFPLSVDGITSTVVLRAAYPGLNYLGTSIPTTKQDVTGLVLMYSTGAQIIPRSSADFVPSATTGFDPDSYRDQKKTKFVSESKGLITLSAKSDETVEIYNAKSHNLLNQSALEGLNTIPVSVRGVVIVKEGTRVSKVII